VVFFPTKGGKITPPGGAVINIFWLWGPKKMSTPPPGVEEPLKPPRIYLRVKKRITRAEKKKPLPKKSLEHPGDPGEKIPVAKSFPPGEIPPTRKENVLPFGT